MALTSILLCSLFFFIFFKFMKIQTITKAINLKVSENIYNAILQIANNEERNVSAQIRHWINEGLKRKDFDIKKEKFLRDSKIRED